MNYSESTLTRKAQAKLNLSLRVLRRREDGFHEVDTLMVPIRGLHDVLTLSPSEHFEFTCDDGSLPTDEGNLVVRAARAYAQAAGVSESIRIHLEKRIPRGAGLGGGSSDAAATLLALNALHGSPLADARLHEIAAALGSDVPFFLQSMPARCTGRGEVLEPLADVKTLATEMVLLKPSFPVATADAYRRALDPTLQAVPGVPYGPQVVEGWEWCNDLEKPVFAKHRFLAEMKLWLLARPEVRAAMMTGSGSTVFALLHDGADGLALVRAAHQELDETFWSWQGEISVPAC